MMEELGSGWVWSPRLAQRRPLAPSLQEALARQLRQQTRAIDRVHAQTPAQRIVVAHQPVHPRLQRRLVGQIRHPDRPATDLVLTVTERLRAHGVVGAYVEAFGDGLSTVSLADRATIANMSPVKVSMTTTEPDSIPKRRAA